MLGGRKSNLGVLGKIREKDLEIFETICRITGENV